MSEAKAGKQEVSSAAIRDAEAARPAVVAVPAGPPRPAPGPRARPLLGHAPELKRDPMRFFRETTSAYGDLVAVKIGPKRGYLLRHPDFLKRVLTDNISNYLKTERLKKATRRVLGEGLLNSEGDFWKRQRRIAQPLFHKQRIAGFADTFVRFTGDMLNSWNALAEAGRPFNASHQLTRLTMRIAGKTLFSYDGGDSEQVGAAVEQTSVYAYQQAMSVVPTPEFVPTRGMRRTQAARRTLDTTVMGLIAERRRSGAQENDLLSMLTLARDEETGEGMTDKQLRDEVMTFYLAGHETTSNTLAWTMYLLGLYPTVQRQVRDEVRAVLGGRLPTLEDLPKLDLTTRVLDESMRLFPPAWLLMRQSVNEDEMGGYRIEPGSQIFLLSFLVHRDPRYWDNPEGFDPDHFLPEKVKQRPRYAYVPFSGGQRQCIGAAFAMMEMQIVLAMMVRDFHVKLAPGAEVVPEPAFTLRPKTGVPVSIEKV